jgi:hypothetical protein
VAGRPEARDPTSLRRGLGSPTQITFRTLPGLRGCDAAALFVTAGLLKVAGGLRVSRVLVFRYGGNFDVVLLLFFGVRHVEHHRTNLGLAEGTGILVGLFALDRDVVFLSDLGILSDRW